MGTPLLRKPWDLPSYALETTTKLFNMVPSKIVPQTPYEISHGKPASYKSSKVCGSPAYVKRLVRDKLDFKSSLCRTYGEAMLDINWDKWFKVMRFEMDPIGSTQVSTLVDPPKGIKPVACKWVYKRKLGADVEVTTFNAMLMEKGYTQRVGVNFEKSSSPVAMAMSIKILLSISTWSIYGLKQASQSWNTWFDKVIRVYDFIKNEFDPYVYKKISENTVAYVVLHVDDMLLIGNDVKMLGDIKAQLSTQFSMKHMDKTSYILGIKIYRDRSRRMLRLTRSSYIEKILKRFKMENSK
ncbi:hypothetical protein Sango_0015500 [Sesamum angolense]|uniref:Reverse transcriptase Ty1/copia-type domain-containing protein n=1 Tax=Sesamum angolense TaxID=2727404 RepID=A0AAE1XCP1_9LAMI|nr:hypothetical protein Sango_0015500 [Sesamum angolense]